ncbi:hypothetical protein [Roseomonas indoligenes]|uniref:PepSY domain-containing protein n=1 Tax=Roseomonas indoligenes TaxID=2820811 RepID=A0A940N0I4_9PROT|nr:hypothetical protein [Pararoseomonas indoligenes]MBP0494274.1 hypothetical protein [Pararoseomonas indoligenes]
MRHRHALAAAALAAAWHIPAQAQTQGQIQAQLQAQTAGGPGCAELARIVQLLPGGPNVFPTEAAPNGAPPAAGGTPPAARGGTQASGPPGAAPATATPVGPVRTTLLPPGALRATVSAQPAETRYVADLSEGNGRRGGADRSPQVLRQAAERVAACYRGVRPAREPNGTGEDNFRFTVAPGTEIAVVLDGGPASTVSLVATRRVRR